MKLRYPLMLEVILRYPRSLFCEHPSTTANVKPRPMTEEKPERFYG